MKRADFVTDRDIEHLLALLMPYNAAAIRISLATGLRIGDVLALPRRALTQRQITIREQKTGKRRRISVPASVRRELLQITPDGCAWAFPGRDPENHRTRQAVWKDLKRAAKALRLRGVVSPHSARKAYAVDLMRRTGDLRRVQRALNHEHAETTMIYALADQLSKRRKGT